MANRKKFDLADFNVKVAIAYGIMLIIVLLLFIAFVKK